MMDPSSPDSTSPSRRLSSATIRAALSSHMRASVWGCLGAGGPGGLDQKMVRGSNNMSECKWEGRNVLVEIDLAQDWFYL